MKIVALLAFALTLPFNLFAGNVNQTDAVCLGELYEYAFDDPVALLDHNEQETRFLLSGSLPLTVPRDDLLSEAAAYLDEGDHEFAPIFSTMNISEDVYVLLMTYRFNARGDCGTVFVTQAPIVAL